MRRLFTGFALAAMLTGCATVPPGSPAPSAQLVTEIYVRDLQGSRAFYEKLGFVVTHTETTFIELQFGGRKFFLSERKGVPVPANPAANIRIGVADVDRFYALARGMGVKIVTP